MTSQLKRIPYYFFIIFILTSCISTQKTNIIHEPDFIIIESSEPIDLISVFDEYKIFSPYEKINTIKDVNQMIAEAILKYNLSYTYKSLSDTFEYMNKNFNEKFTPSKDSYTNFFIKKNNGRCYYILHNTSQKDIFYFRYYDIEINESILKTTHEKALKYTYKMLEHDNNLKKIELYKKPIIEKSNMIPYTAYSTQQKWRTITKYDSSGKPYSATEYYTEQVPYTDYYEEKYPVPNPDYNLEKAQNLEVENNKIYEEAQIILEDMHKDVLYKFTYYIH